MKLDIHFDDEILAISYICPDSGLYFFVMDKMLSVGCTVAAGIPIWPGTIPEKTTTIKAIARYVI